MCLTDGDEESLRLAENNVRHNLPSTRGQHRLGQPAGGSDVHPTYSRSREGDASRVNESTSGVRGGIRASYSDDLSIAGEGPGAPKDDPQTRRGRDGDHLLNEECAIGCMHHNRSAKDSNRQQLPTVSVRKLRWGCSADIEACCRSGDDDVPWDVVLGSDIAALPYASAYGDLLETISSLVHQNRCTVGSGSREEKAAEGVKAAAEVEPVPGGGGFCSTNHSSEVGKRRRVVVLLAHKRRHVSEDAFFDGVRRELVGEGCVDSCQELGDDDVHTDFRGMGIRLHAFTVDVR